MNEVVEQPVAMGAPTRYDENGMTEKQSHQPSRMECLRDYRIEIEFYSIGCVIRVGCKTIAFPTVKEGMKALNDYIANPYETRKIWEERFSKEEEL